MCRAHLLSHAEHVLLVRPRVFHAPPLPRDELFAFILHLWRARFRTVADVEYVAPWLDSFRGRCQDGVGAFLLVNAANTTSTQLFCNVAYRFSLSQPSRPPAVSGCPFPLDIRRRVRRFSISSKRPGLSKTGESQF